MMTRPLPMLRSFEMAKRRLKSYQQRIAKMDQKGSSGGCIVREKRVSYGRWDHSPNRHIETPLCVSTPPLIM